MFSLVVFGLMGPEFENVKESWFLIMLFTDIPKVTRMAQFALTSSHQRRIPANIAVGSIVHSLIEIYFAAECDCTLASLQVGMAQLGLAAMAFETLGKICGLTHYKRLELLATFAVTTVIVDFLIFMRYVVCINLFGNSIKQLFL